MKKAVAILMLLATVLTMSSCGFKKKIYFSEEKYEENLSKDNESYSIEQSKFDAEQSEAISKVEEKVGKSEKDKTFCYKLQYPNYVEYAVVTFKNKKAKSKEIYRFFYSESRYLREVQYDMNGTEKVVDHDDDTLMIKYKETDVSDLDWDYYVERYEDKSDEICEILR